MHALIDKRNELRNALYAAADEFTSEIDTLSIRDRVNVLKVRILDAFKHKIISELIP